MKKITKKAFRERCDFHTYTGSGSKTKVIYYDWQTFEHTDMERRTGFKYAVREGREKLKAIELFNILYDWVVNEVQPPYYVGYKYAPTDKDRFKVPLSLNF
jgi:nicotinamide mononucleotide adenylyltransferase